MVLARARGAMTLNGSTAAKCANVAEQQDKSHQLRCFKHPVLLKHHNKLIILQFQ
jgi:hypothetical protein